MNNIKRKKEKVYLKSKPRFEVLDGLRGVAAIIVVIFHLFEVFSESPIDQIINHGYLAVDFFYVLSGFVIGYAYDDRWNKMSYWDFYKRRLIRLHPMVIASTFLGVFYFFLEKCEYYTKMDDINPYFFILVIIMSLLNLPTTKNIEIRGWGETNSLNSTSWTLQYEYLINILYSLIIRRLSTTIIALLTILSGFLIINLALNIDIFNVLLNRDERKYTVIGGWELSSCELCIGFTRLLYPFFCGYLIHRLKLSIKIPFSFIICSIILSITLCYPRIGGEDGILNGLYETIIILLIYPLIVIIGAGNTENNEIIIKICKFLGELSYPLYISHNPIIYCDFSLEYYHMNDSLFNKIGVSVGSFFIIMFNTYALMKLYDEPIRKWLTNKYLIKKQKKGDNDDNIEESDNKYKKINKTEKEDNGINLNNEIINEDNNKRSLLSNSS